MALYWLLSLEIGIFYYKEINFFVLFNINNWVVFLCLYFIITYLAINISITCRGEGGSLEQGHLWKYVLTELFKKKNLVHFFWVVTALICTRVTYHRWYIPASCWVTKSVWFWVKFYTFLYKLARIAGIQFKVYGFIFSIFS